MSSVKRLWMAERLETLPAMQVAWVRFPDSSRPMFSVENLALFCNPASSGARSQALQLRL
jgi:hypothetical protein